MFLFISMLHSRDSLLGNVSVVTGSLLAGKFVLMMIILAGKNRGRFWKLNEKRGFARRWEQLYLSQQHKKFNQ